MPAPKRKVSRKRRDQGRAHKKYDVPHNLRTCPQCGEPTQQHRVCLKCGYFRGKEVIEIPLE